MVHDAKHHFGPKRMAHDLDAFSIRRMAAKLAQYLAHCPECQTMQTDRRKLLDEVVKNWCILRVV
ncbi:hypothetical protein F5Y00DRAFT_245059 [Daldinia vernicosa]|uniref:uncharacterized protein n=1 Tax=Daldinia vernicosa TaxID=114800 RepID=UPI00200792DC|nr:uncharacterized protein F5Y00DRAFT_245059 [Daldinia vernicosa]KAI0845983.1 hypothetical protein F5Y00DRAFT_245059 [Daldinia vernicosa]